MANLEPAFDRVGEQFLSYYDTPRGYVREQLTTRNLEPFMTPPAAPEVLQVADVGGGDGRYSIWAAGKGAEVLLVDPSVKMLAEARRELGSQPAKIRNRISIEQGDVHSLAAKAPEKFDVVFSHAVLMYDLDDPDLHLRSLVSLLREDGCLSLLTKGNAGAVKRLVRKKDFEGLKELYKTGQTVNNLGERVWAFTEDQLMDMVATAGGRVLTWAGVRILSDEYTDHLSNYSQAHLDRLLEAEAEFGSHPLTRGTGQLLHFIIGRA